MPGQMACPGRGMRRTTPKRFARLYALLRGLAGAPRAMCEGRIISTALYRLSAVHLPTLLYVLCMSLGPTLSLVARSDRWCRPHAGTPLCGPLQLALGPPQGAPPRPYSPTTKKKAENEARAAKLKATRNARPTAKKRKQKMRPGQQSSNPQETRGRRQRRESRKRG